jgi:hypothetical protein
MEEKTAKAPWVDPDVPVGFTLTIFYWNEMPYPVNLNLPGQGAHDPPRKIGGQLDITIPTDNASHLALGRFMHAWSYLENVLTNTVHLLMAVDHDSATLTTGLLGLRKTMDLIAGLARLKLEHQDAKKMINLTERLGKLNSKRNVLVHGGWNLEVNIIALKGEAVLLQRMVRAISPSNPSMRNIIGNPKNQKERVRYVFTINRIEGAKKDTNKLAYDFAELSRSMKFLQKSVSYDLFAKFWNIAVSISFTPISIASGDV